MSKAVDQNTLDKLALSIVKLLIKKNKKLVLAESCTGGLISSSLAKVPGASSALCGSLVVYRNETKDQWLGISKKLLKQFDPVSKEISRAMAINAAKKTKESDISAAVTGHVGPNAPAHLDGVVYLTCLSKRPKRIVYKKLILQNEFRFQRQLLASQALLLMVRSLLKQH